MKRPEVGARFENPRGKVYEVIAHTLDPNRAVVQEPTYGFADLASWRGMTEENGWRRLPDVPRTSEASSKGEKR